MTRAVIIPSDAALEAAILTRRLRKCIAEGSHHEQSGKCERCGQ